MTVVVGCPVAWREWALPTWLQCLSEQTVQPDAFVFVHGGRRGDDTEVVLRNADRYFFQRDHVPQVAIAHHELHPTQRGSINKTDDRLDRYLVLADARNRMLALARLYFNPDVFISLDSDVMCHDPRTIERLVQMVTVEGWDTASPLTYLHMREAESWGWNAGWWKHSVGIHGPHTRQFTRQTIEDIDWGATLEIDIPMAAVAMSRRVLADCRYGYHEGGEDLAFAAALEQAGASSGWDTSLYARHVWDQGALHDKWLLPAHLRERRYDE